MKKLWRIKIGKFYLLKGDLNNLDRIEITANIEGAFLFCSKRLADCYAAKIGGFTEAVPFTGRTTEFSPVAENDEWKYLENEFVIKPVSSSLN